MRLRPSGNKGPVATSLESFRVYHRESAWTWERLALTRARPVSGDESLRQELAEAISAALRVDRDPGATARDVLDMRRLMLKEHQPSSVWDIKRIPGGLIDLEFIAQYLQLIHASRKPGVLSTTTAIALERLQEAEVLSRGDAHDLREANALYHRLTQVLRLCQTGAFDPPAAPDALNRLVANAAASPDIASAEALLTETQARVRDCFDRLVGPFYASTRST
jgi:glutamate-ammonia-ligase adenylyltransferase